MSEQTKASNSLNDTFDVQKSILESLGLDGAKIMSSLSDVILIVDQKGKILFINKVAEGIDILDVIGTNISDYVHKEELSKIKTIINRVFLTGKEDSCESRGLLEGGTSVWYSCSLGAIKKEKKVLGIIIVARDVTVKKNYEETLLKDILDEKKQNEFHHNIPDQIFLVNREGRFLDFSLSKDFQPYVPPDVFLGKFMSEVLPDSIARKSYKTLEKAFVTRKTQTLEYRLLEKNDLKNFEARFIIISENECMLVVRDLTETMSFKEEFLSLVSQEQKRIGHDLHDGLSQHLTGIAFLGKVLEKQLLSKGLAEASEARKIVALVNDAIDHTRRLAHGLHLVELETSHLRDAIEELATTAEEIYRIKCSLEYNKNIKIEDIDTKIHVYRIVQEAINNAIKHGKAKNIQVKVLKKEKDVCFSIEDDGVGIDDAVKRKEETGTGIKIMEYRASMIGAAMDVEPLKKGGTLVELVLFDQEGT